METKRHTQTQVATTEKDFSIHQLSCRPLYTANLWHSSGASFSIFLLLLLSIDIYMNGFRPLVRCFVAMCQTKKLVKHILTLFLCTHTHTHPTFHN